MAVHESATVSRRKFLRATALAAAGLAVGEGAADRELRRIWRGRAGQYA
jgi:hypothetical protein